MTLSIDVDRYIHLPDAVRNEFDAWLDAEGLLECLPVKMTLGEGAVTLVCIDFEAVEGGGKKITFGPDGKAVHRTVTVLVRTLPPLEALV